MFAAIKLKTISIKSVGKICIKKNFSIIYQFGLKLVLYDDPGSNRIKSNKIFGHFLLSKNSIKIKFKLNYKFSIISSNKTKRQHKINPNISTFSFY
jgi:hypothetical protein